MSLVPNAVEIAQSERQPAFGGVDIQQAFAQFVTGVVVVVASNSRERAIARVQAFNSVSLDPALVLWSLEKCSDAFPVFKRASHFAAHVLAHEQRALMQQGSAIDQSSFAGAEDPSEKAGAHKAAFDGCSAWFECAGIGYFDGGDHGCFIGRIENFSFSETRPLITYAGAYRALCVHPDAHPGSPQ